MRDLCRLSGWTVVDLIRSRAKLEAEMWTLRQQINVLRRAASSVFSDLIYARHGLEKLVDPVNYLGIASEMVDRVLKMRKKS